MTITLFEIACVVIVALTLAIMTRARSGRLVLRDYGILAVAAWLGEDTCVALYRFYAYAPAWHGRIHHVPVLVPLIWPLVILSARDVVSSLWPDLRMLRPLAVGALVAFDASLVEVVAVRAHLWSWAEPGHLGVPVIGILGWGYFAIGADVGLSRRHPSLAIATAPLAAHGLIVLTWWIVFRWIARGALEPASAVGLVAIAAVALGLVVLRRRAGDAIAMHVALPRMVAAALFVGLLLTTAPGDAALWTHAASVAVPYLVATEWSLTGRRSRGALRGSRAPSPR